MIHNISKRVKPQECSPKVTFGTCTSANYLSTRLGIALFGEFGHDSLDRKKRLRCQGSMHTYRALDCTSRLQCIAKVGSYASS